MNMKTNYLKLNSWAVAALMGMCSLAACSDDNKAAKAAETATAKR